MKEDDMSKWTMVAVFSALAGCAGVQSSRQLDRVSGHWVGEIERDGLSQPVSLAIERQGGVYRGEWRPAAGLRGKPLENVEVQGDQVRFETDKLRFVGHLNGSTLAGTVAHKPEDAPIGDFVVTSGDQDQEQFQPGSEWSPLR
jgi:hypothetical protein